MSHPHTTFTTYLPAHQMPATKSSSATLQCVSLPVLSLWVFSFSRHSRTFLEFVIDGLCYTSHCCLYLIQQWPNTSFYFWYMYNNNLLISSASILCSRILLPHEFEHCQWPHQVIVWQVLLWTRVSYCGALADLWYVLSFLPHHVFSSLSLCVCPAFADSFCNIC